MNSCERIHALADAYLDNELNADRAMEFARHLKECPQLARLISMRQQLRNRVRSAARTIVAPPGLETRIRAAVDRPRRQLLPGWPVLALAAALLITVGVGTSWRNGAFRFTPESQQAYVDSLRPGLAPAMQVGLQQHIHCTVYRKLTSPYPTLAEMAQELGPGNADLIPVMQRALPADFRVILAHRCNYHGRIYLHIAASDGRHLVSLLVTDRASGEAFENDLHAVAAENDMQLYTSSVQRFAISGFETRDRLVYLVSDLDPSQNLSTFHEMVPEIARTIRTRES